MSFNKKICYTHRLIFVAHYGAEELIKHQCIDHINGDKKDNRIENLRGLSIKENTLEAEKLGNFKRANGEINGKCKIKKEELGEIKYLYEFGFTQYEIADFYKVSQSQISDILNKKSRKFG